MSGMNNRFYLAMGFYALLAVLAVFTLEGKFRLAILVFLAGLAVKTWLVILRKDEEE